MDNMDLTHAIERDFACEERRDMALARITSAGDTVRFEFAGDSVYVYDDVPANRYVLLNSKRMREGDELPDGIRLERITAQGVVLNVHGHRFVLIAGGL